jgi:hypothetical protein
MAIHKLNSGNSVILYVFFKFLPKVVDFDPPPHAIYAYQIARKWGNGKMGF